MTAILIATWRRPRPMGPLPYLRAWRQWAGISQRQLAARAGVTFANVCVLEQGDRNAKVSTVARLAGVLGIPVDVFRYYAPSDAVAARWARDVALRFAHERMGLSPRSASHGGKVAGSQE